MSTLLDLQVDSQGLVNIVHSPTDKHFLAANSTNKFRIDWFNDVFPNVQYGCSEGCTASGSTCLCDVTVETKAVFIEKMPTVQEIKAHLHIGSPAPEMFDSGVYTECTAQLCLSQPGVAAYTPNQFAAGKFNAETIFKVTLHGKSRYFSNKESQVSISSNFKFRNPPHFLDLYNPTVEQAEDETDATLDHYFFHENTAPFISHQLIQRFVTSNPSPRYIKAVAEAFVSGSYDGFGTGEYGDLKATIAAILLDSEARTPLLELDATHGRLREPLLKVLQVMRALEFKSTFQLNEPDLRDLALKIGMAYLKQVQSYILHI